MDRLHQLEVFVAVAEAGGLARAGKRLRISPPAVTRAVASLERRLGTRLFHRTTRSLSLTEPGERFLANARRLLGELRDAERDALGEGAEPAGLLRITASVTLGRELLAPVVRAFLREQPRVSASLLLLDRVVDLVEEGLDVAVRIAQLPDSSLVARRVGEVRRVLVASPRYLARHGRPREPAELKTHAVIGFTGLLPQHEWRFGTGRAARHVTVSPRLELNDAAAALAAAEAGEGIAVALSYMVARSLARGRLALVLDEWMPPPVPVQLVHAQGRLAPPKLRAFLDFAAPRLAKELTALRVGPAREAR